MVKISTNQVAQNRPEHRKILKGLVYLPIFSIDSAATENGGQ
jgi:hypothetical protein